MIGEHCNCGCGLDIEGLEIQEVNGIDHVVCPECGKLHSTIDEVLAGQNPAMDRYDIVTILRRDRDRWRDHAQAIQAIVQAAHHELTTLHGLWACDNFDAYDQALADGCDHNAAWKRFCDEMWQIDTALPIEQIDNALAATPVEITEGQARIALHDRNLEEGWPDPRDKQIAQWEQALQKIAAYGREGKRALRDIMAKIAADALKEW